MLLRKVSYKDLGGESFSFYESFESLYDDPYRWLATVVSRKCDSRDSDIGVDSSSEALEGSYAWHYPVLIKSDVKGEDTPFVEFMVADILYKKLGDSVFRAEVERVGDNPSKALVEKVRSILLQNVEVIEGLRVVDIPTDYLMVSCDYSYEDC